MLWCSGLSAAPSAQSRGGSALPALLERAGRYVTAFQGEFARVVGFERYRQEVHAPGGGQLVNLESEVFFIGLDQQRTWITVRNVLSVDGRSVEGSSGSTIELLAERGNRARLRELADASASYNIGHIQRNFNDPTLALSFLAPSSQWRFRFSDQGTSAVDGVPLHRVTFDERERPTIIRDPRGRNAPSSGVLLIADDGRVMRSELEVNGPRDTSSKISVTFADEARLEMMVPTLMEEEYRTAASPLLRELITCRATYSNYRRFETRARILPPADAATSPR